MPRSVASTDRRVVETREITPDARVRHFDELSERAQRYVARAADGDPSAEPLPGDLRAGDVIVHTRYLSVV